MVKIFIDGREGTTGLKIYDRLKGRDDIELLSLSDGKRKDTAARRETLNSADIVFLCLPDDAARQAVSLVENPDTKIIDASTAHRTQSGWSYGFPELSREFRESIARARRIAVPGCHASGFAALVYPLISMGIMPESYPLSCFSITGYSGGGKKMIAEYENKEGRGTAYESPRQYALSQNHKHLKEMKHICMLEREPLFSPVVADFYSGMQVSLPIYSYLLNKKPGAKDVYEMLSGCYKDAKLIDVTPFGEEAAFMPANLLAGRDNMLISVSGNDERILLTATFDNLGKGASGAAVQCMNIAMGIAETSGLIL